MNPTSFTVEEENIICIFRADSRAAVMDGIRAATPHMDDPDMWEIAETTIRKLTTMTDAEFSAYIFAPAYDGGETEV